MVDVRDQLLNLVRTKGPCLPSDVYKELNTNQLFASAMLGELVSNGLIKLTYLKRGSSPYYYTEEQKEKLQDFVQYLNDKDRLAFNLIKEKQILKDSELTPLMRVAMRTIRDYAVPLNVNHDEQIQVFWKFYLLSNQEAEIKIKQFLGILPQEKKPIEKKEEQKHILPVKEIKQEIKQEVLEEKQKIPSEIKTPFFEQIVKHFSKNGIIVLSQE